MEGKQLVKIHTIGFFYESPDLGSFCGPWRENDGELRGDVEALSARQPPYMVGPPAIAWWIGCVSVIWRNFAIRPPRTTTTWANTASIDRPDRRCFPK